MLEFQENTDSRSMEITIDGYIDHNSFQNVAGHFEKRIDEWGKIKLLKKIKAFHGINVLALIEDLRLAYRHFNNVSRVAFVTDRYWVELLSTLVKPIFPCQVKVFVESEIVEARQWLDSNEVS